MVPVIVLAVIWRSSFIRVLMGVVAHDETAGAEPATADFTLTQAYDPTIRLRSNTNDARTRSCCRRSTSLRRGEPATVEPANETSVGGSAGASDRAPQLG